MILQGGIVKKVFHFDAPRDKYQCDAAILWCFDNRFELGCGKPCVRRQLGTQTKTQ